MIKVILSGCGGYMGNVLSDLIEKREDMEVVAGIDKAPPENRVYPVYLKFEDCSMDADVIIDFTHPSAVNSILKYATANNCALVLATTGYTSKDNERIAKASAQIPIFKSGSMSMGINLLKSLLQKAAEFLEDDFDIEIVERHHNRKVDAPSGTALLLADAINDSLTEKRYYNCARSGADSKRSHGEIGIHAVRGGTIVGEHQIIFAGNDEIIEFKHTSLSRNIFAVGAIKAARFLIDKTAGQYNMDDML